MSAPSLIDLGMRPFFQQQLSLEELEHCALGRVIELHKSEVVLLAGDEPLRFPLNPNHDPLCVGDWVVFNDERLVRGLERQSLFQRKAAGSANERQLIAANIDTVFIVSSLNDDFSLNRIERYLALAKETYVEPVIVLTKADLCADADAIRQQVQRLDALLSVHCVNALDSNDIDLLKGYCQRGKTLAFMGSSGVGKSTLVNGLLGHDAMETGSIREQDSKGRHTTTYRAIKWLPEGGLLMDTPGMRELQLSDAKDGIKLTFAEIESLAEQCRFSDCQHINEPGCAVLHAVETGALSARRLDNFQKLLREDAHNSATLAQKRAKDKSFQKMINSVQEQARAMKKNR
ncbi:ribosome small subunit-dependent GTPase A [Photobacterium aphoticum]|uniref:Small ribosomal subunit biogenesis GTPase RsgA n=1 Tax=Photobacterium aphoticum TaxID=754436 RepID=A0A0J1GKU4_9GAMM|nr:ribosome small subunit-dependent GTPase A [Photobacterium aphoticum]KLV00323.1 GTPase RsgA [Photobacterium aphoticum]PSU59591.1 ribosome small subunit-dependent GTPase A [Photobacterium aphoticum]GHA39481.1 putative ribosome biogenesis GTPase RsgA [Photobacterium aphoticum]